jgi:hypothetical protein
VKIVDQPPVSIDLPQRCTQLIEIDPLKRSHISPPNAIARVPAARVIPTRSAAIVQHRPVKRDQQA